jgi:hypothetical protein
MAASGGEMAKVEYVSLAASPRENKPDVHLNDNVTQRIERQCRMAQTGGGEV